MANPISSQITTTLNQTRAIEQAAKPSFNVVSNANTEQVDSENVTNRQEVAGSQTSSIPVGQSDLGQKSQLEKAVSDINDYVQTVNRELQFRVDEALPLGRSVVTVVDSDTQEVIREFPSEQALSLARSLKEQIGSVDQQQIEGLIISARA